MNGGRLTPFTLAELAALYGPWNLLGELKAFPELGQRVINISSLRSLLVADPVVAVQCQWTVVVVVVPGAAESGDDGEFIASSGLSTHSSLLRVLRIPTHNSLPDNWLYNVTFPSL